MSFQQFFSEHSWGEVEERIRSVQVSSVEEALHRAWQRLKAPGSRPVGLEDFAALVSQTAEPHLEELARLSRAATQRRFGKIVQLYAPLYLSNECQNICTYCGFSFHNRIPRKTLNPQEIQREVEVLKSLGFDHVLIVTGEANRTVGMEYFREALDLIRPSFSHISMEVQPLDRDEYEDLIKHGLNTVLVYQETYHRKRYKECHPKGRKSNFDYRLETPDRLGEAGIHKIGLGVLIGLADWRVDSWFTALHLSYLRRKYWRTKFSVSFPRLRPAEGVELAGPAMSERQLLQLICAYRLFDEFLELSLSTRESSVFRDNVLSLGVTSMSAGSRTEPGGYAKKGSALEQFSIDDNRTPAEVAEAIERAGYQAVWKDWDMSMDHFCEPQPGAGGVEAAC